MQNLPHYYDPGWIRQTTEVVKADLCIYGASSAGVTAAVTAADRGLSVVLLEPGIHLGGMTSSGLGWTDMGKKAAIGGRARRFYERIGRHYGKEEEWYFEPRIARLVFGEMIAETNVRVLQPQFLASVEKCGTHITSLSCLSGLRVEAKFFIDATYEGDLMAGAGVLSTYGRESNAVHGETLNGIQIGPHHQFRFPLDPYMTEGDPESGLLPGIIPEDLMQKQGEGDMRVQAYNFRVCMTDDPALRLDWEKPDGFDSPLHILATRWLNNKMDHYDDPLVGGRTVPALFNVLPNKTGGGYRKTDSNSYGPVSSDFIGANYGWPQGSYETRERIFQAHVAYQKGYYFHVSHDPAIPKRFRDAYAAWGLSRDEFTETGHWPPQLYVREARRMLGVHIITEHDCMGKIVAEDSVGLGSHQMDSHNCSRFVHQGSVLNEGDVQVVPPKPYPVSYRAMIPSREQCENLIVPVCLSASHVAYGSVRMEPVFMILGESAAIAASLCLNNDSPVQDLPYNELRPELLSAGQILEWTK
jgi:hypothetical protein